MKCSSKRNRSVRSKGYVLRLADTKDKTMYSVQASTNKYHAGYNQIPPCIPTPSSSKAGISDVAYGVRSRRKAKTKSEHGVRNSAVQRLDPQAPGSPGGALPMMHGAAPESSQYTPEPLMLPPQHSLDPPGSEPHPAPAHRPQLRGQHTTPLASMPSMPFEHVWSSVVHKCFSEENETEGGPNSSTVRTSGQAKSKVT